MADEQDTQQVTPEAEAQGQTVSEILRDFNRTKGRDAGAAPAQQPTPATPATTGTPTPTKTPATTAAPAQPATTIPGQAQQQPAQRAKPKDPPFVKTIEPAQPQATATEPAVPAPTAPSQETTPAAPTPEAEASFYGRLSEMTDGSIKSAEDLSGFIQDYNELLTQSQKGFEPKFTDKRAQWAYQLLQKTPGKELEEAERVIRAVRLGDQVKTMDEREALFQAYLLDSKNADLTPAKAARLFDAVFEEKYKDLENSEIAKRLLEVDARDARQSIQKIQDEFNAAQAAAEQAATPQPASQEVQQALGGAIEQFGGVRMAFTDNPTEQDYLAIQASPEELTQLARNALNPQDWHNEMLTRFESRKGFDWESYLQWRFEVENHERIVREAHDHGLRAGQLLQINQDRNATRPADLAQSPGAPPAPSEPGSLFDAWAGAAKRRQA